MEILREITQWNADISRQPNHTYLVNAKSQIVAYAKWHSKNDVQILKSKIPLDKRYRKFEKVNHAELSKIAKQLAGSDNEKEVIKPTEEVRVFNVKSKDKVYTVTFNKNTNQVACECIGFGYRKYCKHSDAVSKQLGVK